MSDEPHYYAPEHGWTCFHCGETFTTAGSAADHFGAAPDATPGCLIRVQYGDERGLQMDLRKAEARIKELEADIENETSSRNFYSSALQSELRSYKPFRECKSIQDVFNVYDSMEGRALAAEESFNEIAQP